MNETYLVHHGILGQKWGKKNGPPYPLDFSKLSAEERHQAKRTSIEKGDVKTAYANKQHYSNSELNELLARFDIEARLGQKVSDLNKQQIAAGKQGINKLTNTLATVESITSKVGNIASNFAKIKNALGGSTSNTANAVNSVAKATKKVTKTVDKNLDNSKAEKKAEKKAAKKEAKKEAKIEKDIEKRMKKTEKQNAWEREQAKGDYEFWKSKQAEHVTGDVVNIDGSPLYDHAKAWNFIDSYMLEDKKRK